MRHRTLKEKHSLTCLSIVNSCFEIHTKHIYIFRQLSVDSLEAKFTLWHNFKSYWIIQMEFEKLKNLEK